MTCNLTWGVRRYPTPSATMFCLTCMAPIEYEVPLYQAQGRLDELLQGHLCRRHHAIHVIPQQRAARTPTQGSLF